MIRLIVAVDRENRIGYSSGELPWSIPADLKRFKELTSGHDVLMGGKTFRSLNRPRGLPNRQNYVLTHGKLEETISVHKVSSIEDFVSVNNDFWLIGGAALYNRFLDELLVDEIYVTCVHTTTVADVKLDLDLYNVTKFIDEQNHKFGAIWTVEEEPSNSSDYQFYILKKVYYVNL